jgi:hypothetical protein
MIEMSESARQRFDEYLHRLRATLRGSRSVQADDVEQSVREHVEIALAGLPAPVGAEHLAPVLERLGSPERWLADDERPAWRRAMERIASGPEDWRLAYLSFSLFVLAMLFFPLGGGFLLIPAYLVSRAYIEFTTGRGEVIGARRWLAYPAIAIPLLLVILLFLVGPVAPLLAWGIGDEGFHTAWNLRANEQPLQERLRIEIGLGAAAFGVWWMAASGIAALLLRPLRFAFAPLLDQMRGRHLLFLTLGGVVAVAVGVAVLYA